jgi:hypothetical protein
LFSNQCLSFINQNPLTILPNSNTHSSHCSSQTPTHYCRSPFPHQIPVHLSNPACELPCDPYLSSGTRIHRNKLPPLCTKTPQNNSHLLPHIPLVLLPECPPVGHNFLQSLPNSTLDSNKDLGRTRVFPTSGSSYCPKGSEYSIQSTCFLRDRIETPELALLGPLLVAVWVPVLGIPK